MILVELPAEVLQHIYLFIPGRIFPDCRVCRRLRSCLPMCRLVEVQIKPGRGKLVRHEALSEMMCRPAAQRRASRARDIDKIPKVMQVNLIVQDAMAAPAVTKAVREGGRRSIMLDVSGIAKVELFSRASLSRLGDLIAACGTCLTGLSLAGNGFQTSDLHLLSDKIQTCSNVTSLDLSGNRLRRGVGRLAANLSRHLTSLTRLDASQAESGRGEGPGLLLGCQPLIRVNTNLKQLNLTCRDDSCRAITPVHHIAISSARANGLDRTTFLSLEMLQEVQLEGNGLTDMDMKIFADSWKAPSLTRLLDPVAVDILTFGCRSQLKLQRLLQSGSRSACRGSPQKQQT